ncbi:MAG: hypothetical protein AAGI69_13795 [Cyanobacteria bacterium P01_H01_bin.21]
MAYSSVSPKNFDKEKIRFGIFSQVLTVILLITVIPLSGLFLTIRDRQQSLQDNLEDDFQSNSELIASGVDSWIDTNILALRQNASTSGLVSIEGTERQDEIGALARSVKRLAASVKVAFDVLKNK